jgi:DNA modification methylase
MILTAPEFEFDKYEAGDYGDHVIIHGDCRTILPKIPDKAIDLVLTDPPYGHRNNDGDLISRWESVFGGNKERESDRPISNDDFESANLYFELLCVESARLLKNGSCCCCCCCCGGGPDPQFARWALMMDKHLAFKQMVVWDKGPMGMGHHYRRSYETVLVANKSGAACKWFDSSKKIENIIRPGDYGIRKIIPNADDHPTPKPIELFQHFIRLHSDVGEICLDPFAGHCTTAVAAKNMGRRSICIEISMDYCKIGEQRLSQEVLRL